MFTRLQTRLAVMSAVLFGGALLLVALAAQWAVSAHARRIVTGEMQASGAVFDRLWTLRAAQMEDGARLISHDFGFRQALATGDAPTVGSALDNLADRLGVDRGIVVRPDGAVIGTASPEMAGVARRLSAFADPYTPAAGLLMLNGQPLEAVLTPVLAPEPQGWVLFTAPVDAKALRALERLSPIPLSAAVVQPSQVQGEARKLVQAALTDRAGRAATPGLIGERRGRAIALARPLKGLDGKVAAGLLLTYPLAQAMAPFQSLLQTVYLIALGGLVLVVAGSWLLARGVARPIAALDAAVHRLEAGEAPQVEVAGRDEVARLAHSFNGLVGAVRDREARITQLAQQDSETGLPNRQALESAAARVAGPGGPVFAIALGIDRYTHFRAAIGHTLAAELAGEVGRRLIARHPELSAARLSDGVLGLAGRGGLTEGERIAASVQATLAGAYRVGGADVDVGLTAGLAVLPLHAPTPPLLIERAGIALGQAQAARRSVMAFDAEAYGDPASNLSLMSEMLKGMASGDFDLHHQPKYDLRARRVTGVEALARWTHVERGRLSPELFVGMAEETGHIRAMTDWVLERAIADQAALAQAGHDLVMSVNLSGRLLAEDGFMQGLAQRIAASPGRLCMEVTETAVIAEPERAIANLDALAAAGGLIAIDDYGSGLSSLSYLKQLNAHELKIDKAFVLGMDRDGRDALLVRSTISLAHSLGMKVTAEGVETDTHAALLAGMGCDMAQGYGVARPMGLPALLEFLQREQPAGAERRAHCA